MFLINKFLNYGNFTCLKKNLTVKQAVELMAKHRMPEVPLVDDDGRAIGQIDLFSLAGYLLQSTGEEKLIPESYFQSSINTIENNEILHNAAYFPVDRIVVNSDGKFCGILKKANVIRGLMREIDVLHDVLENFNIGIAMISTKGDLIFANDFFRHLIGMELSNSACIPFEDIVSAVSDANKPGQVSQKHHYSINGSHIILEYRPVTLGTRQLGILAILSQKDTGQSDRQQQKSNFHHLLTKPGYKNEIIDIIKDYIFEDPLMKQVLELCAKTAQSSSSVLITGETGVGKEVIVDILHRLSTRANKPLVKVNCAAIPDTLIESELFGYEKGAFTGAVREGKIGLIEAANEGTLFLDEITELPLRLQAKLLRFLQSKEYYKLGSTKAHHVDLRVITASNCEISLMVDQGTFRPDLYYRLCVIPINVPPLRERLADIVPLALHFINHYCRLNNVEKQFSPAALLALQRYDWPGNVRELQHMTEQMTILSNSSVIEVADLPKRVGKEMQPKTRLKVEVKELIPLKEAYQIVERELLREAMRTCKSARQIGQKLGIDHSTVLRKLKIHDQLGKL